jgi:hypothetical protein
MAFDFKSKWNFNVPDRLVTKDDLDNLQTEDAALEAYVDSSLDELANGLLNSQSAVLTAALNEVESLGGINHWTVSEPTTVSLPVTGAGTSVLVHVESGYEDLTWPPGTVIYGDAGAVDEAWVTLIREEVHWSVLIPAAAVPPSAVADTGWVMLAQGTCMMGIPTYTAGSAAVWSNPTHWGPPGAAELYVTFRVRIRRIGQVAYLGVCGVEAKQANPSAAAFSIPTWAQASSTPSMETVRLVTSITDVTYGGLASVGVGTTSMFSTSVGVTNGDVLGAEWAEAMLSWPIPEGVEFPEL